MSKIFTRLPLICTMSKKDILCVLALTGKTSFDMQRRIQHSIIKTLPFCELETIFKSLLRVANKFNFKEVLLKSSILGLLGVICAIVAMLIITAKLKAICFPSSTTYGYFVDYR